MWLAARRSIAALAGALLLAPCASGSQTPLSLTVVTSPSDAGGEVYYAKELGIFAKHGLDVEIIPVANGEAAGAAIISGKYPIGQGNIVAIATARDHGIPVVVVAPAAIYDAKTPTTGLVVRSNSPLRSGADLAGKTVGAPGLRDIGSIALDAWLRQQGADPSAVRMVEMPSAQLAAALERGTIDAASMIEPYLGAALTGGNRVLGNPYSAVGARFVIAAYFTTGDWLKAHGATARAFAAAIAETARWANANHAASARILEKYTLIHLSPAQTRPEYAEKLDPAQLQPLIDAAAKDAVLRTAFPAATLLVPPPNQ
jgi:NitT/TauT family transport system substrate-binding protein